MEILTRPTKTVVIGLTAAEVEALEAAGRAAGYSTTEGTLHALLNEALDVGFGILREQPVPAVVGTSTEAV